MHLHAVTPILNVSDVPASVEWFERLGWQRSFTWNQAGMIACAELRNQHGPAGFAGIRMPRMPPLARPVASAATKTSSSATTHAGRTTNTGGGADAEDPGSPQIFLCKDGQGSRDPRPCPDPHGDNFGGVWMSWWVDGVDAAHAECLAAKAEIVRPPVNEPWGVREFLIRHPDGHYFRISGHVK